MARHRYALIVLVVAALCLAAEGQTPLAPEAGVLSLKNGQIIEGRITRAGDYFIVTKGEGSELRLKTDEVEAFCGSLIEAYEFKERHLAGQSGRSHVELAKWCLRHGLYDKCAEQLAIAERLEPGNPQIAELQTRLKLVVEATPPPAAAQSTSVAISPEELEKTVRALPKASVEKFGAVVQPILLNRCGLNQCHGPNAKSEFRLLRPPAGQIVTRRFTQRNLYMAVKYLDGTNPEFSPLVMMPQQRHGNSLAAVFDKHSVNQLAELVAWARMTTGAPPPTAVASPATIAPTQTTLSQPAGDSPPLAPAQTSAPANPVGVRLMRPTLDQPTSQRPPAPRDRFDPEIFNQRYHNK